MGTPIYQHWVGQMIVKAGLFSAATHPVDAWFPAAKPAGATLIGQDVSPTPTNLFADVLRLDGKVGPFKIRVNISLAFAGTVEDRQGPALGVPGTATVAEGGCSLAVPSTRAEEAPFAAKRQGRAPGALAAKRTGGIHFVGTRPAV